MTVTILNQAMNVGIVTGLLALSACDGPNEVAGREQDRAAALANNSTQVGEGANEARGEALDRSQDAAAAVREAKADALEKQGDQMRTDADIAADKLDQQAKRVRDGQAK